MSKVCPQCHASFEQGLLCPKCGVGLDYVDLPRRPVSTPDLTGDNWRQTPWGRIVVGLLLAQGLYYGLRHLCTAILLGVGQGQGGSLSGLVLLQAMQAVGLLAGGALAGAGQGRGVIYGALVGLWNGALTVLVQYLIDRQVATTSLYGTPILHTAFGVLGGFIGSVLWKPAPALLVPPPIESALVLSSEKKPSMFDGPVAWVRVLAGVAVAVGGTIWANVILEFVIEAGAAGNIPLMVASNQQAMFVTWEISVLAMLVGAALAGSTTPNGIKQGMMTGILAGSVLTCIYIALGGQTAKAQMFVFSLFDAQKQHFIPLEAIIYTMSSSYVLGLVGGWFGGQLLPPASKLGRRRRLRAAIF